MSYSPWGLHTTERLHFHFFTFISNCGGGYEDNGDLLQKAPCTHCYTQCPQPCNRPPLTQQHPPPETPGHSQASLGQSIVGSLLFSPGSWCAQALVCALQETCVKFWRLYGGVNGDLLQAGLCHTQVYCTQSPCPCSSPLLTHTSTGDTLSYVSLCDPRDYSPPASSLHGISQAKIVEWIAISFSRGSS